MLRKCLSQKDKCVMPSAREETKIWQQIKQLQYTPKEERTEFDYRLPMMRNYTSALYECLGELADLSVLVQQKYDSNPLALRVDLFEFGSKVKSVLLENLFITDVHFAFEQKADVLFFSIQKDHIDRFKGSSSPKTKENYTSALYECLGELADLSVLVQQKYGFVIKDVPAVASMCPKAIVPCSSSSSLSPRTIRRFSHFICLRMGDLFRYLGDMKLARELYVCAFRANPNDGQACNQIGLIEGLERHHLEALYYHVVALNAHDSFMPAASNIEQIYNRFASINIEDHNTDYDLVFLKLSSFDPSVLQRMSCLLQERTPNCSRLAMHFVIAVSVWYALGGSQDEVRCSNHVITVIADQFTILLEQSLKEEQTRREKEQLLSTLWIYASWIEAKKISLMNRVTDDAKWIRNLAVLIDTCDNTLTLKCDNHHFLPLSFMDYENASTESLVRRLTVILWRTLKSYRIPDVPNDNFTAFVDAHISMFTERRKPRVSRTVAVLSAM
ncbi:hypothetical protein Tcan_07101 [Toxocara canis]|uniref:Uncharacterized protein n=1 Tax=Toxocara canis TaxID=6265 RepID=A0A0B2VTH0_TOXCA|nr:hypothetical protein Tcan_07101 [Toxocara canis]